MMARESATAKDAQFVLISILPDVCFTPSKPPQGVPVPYPVTHKMDKSKQCSSNVFFKGKPAYLHEASYVERVTGDEAGAGKGVVSNTNTHISRSTQYSSSVYINGKRMVRTGDMVRMNRGNTVGMIVLKTMPAPQGASSNPSLNLETQAEQDFATWRWAYSVSMASSKPVMGVENTFVHAAEIPALIEATIDSGLRDNVSAYLEAASKRPFTGAKENRHPPSDKIGEPAQKLPSWKTDFIAAHRLQGKSGRVTAMSKTPGNNRGGAFGPGGGGGYIKGKRCVVGTYREVRKQCQGGQAHHIVPDTLNRAGNRRQGKKDIDRIQGTPSFQDGPSICLQGNARTQGTEHNTAHQCDVLIQAAGQRTDNSPEGTIPVAEALELAIQSARAARPDCLEEIRAQVKQAYYPDETKDYNKDDRLLNAAGQPASAEARKHLKLSSKVSINGARKTPSTKGN